MKFFFTFQICRLGKSEHHAVAFKYARRFAAHREKIVEELRNVYILRESAVQYLFKNTFSRWLTERHFNYVVAKMQYDCPERE